MGKDSEQVAIVFADICGSTRIYEKLGDRNAKSLITHILGRLSDVTEAHRGTVVKSIGDELMCTFPSGAHAVDAAVDMNQAVDRVRIHPDPGLDRVSIHTGIHAGLVVWDDDDIYGDSVNVAARLVSLAKPRQVLTTKEVADALDPDRADRLRYVDRTTVKGKAEEVEIYEVLWEEDGVTVLTDAPAIEAAFRAMTAPCRMELAGGETKCVVTPALPSASLGRLAQNDVVIDGPLVSRYHARVEYRRGSFVLIDQSSNGSYVIASGEEPRFVRRGETPLSGSGLIGLGEVVTEESPRAIRYALEE